MSGGALFSWPQRVYYQHTDAGGVVFHGDYLNFMEAARAELLRSMGFNVGELARTEGIVFVVHKLEITYLRPARLGDALETTVKCLRVGGVRLILEQAVLRDGRPLVSAQVTLACVHAGDQRPIALPKVIKDAFERRVAVDAAD